MESPLKQESADAASAVDKEITDIVKKKKKTRRRKKNKKSLSNGTESTPGEQNDLMKSPLANGQRQTDQPKFEISAADGGGIADSPKKKPKRNRRKRKNKEKADNKNGADDKDAIESPAKRMRINDTTGEGEGQDSVAPEVSVKDEDGASIVAKKKRRRSKKRKTANVSIGEGEADGDCQVKRLKVEDVMEKPVNVTVTVSTSEAQASNVPVDTGTPVEKKKKKTRRKKKKKNSPKEEISQNSGETKPNESNKMPDSRGENQANMSEGKESKVSPKKKRRRNKSKSKKRENSEGGVQSTNNEGGNKTALQESIIKNETVDNIVNNVKKTLSSTDDVDGIVNSVKKRLSGGHGDSVKEHQNGIPSSPAKPNATEGVTKVEPIESSQASDVGQAIKEKVVSVSAKLHELYSDQPRKEEITKCWTETSLLQKDNGFELLDKPFRCCYMPEFLQKADFLQKVKEELASVDLVKKSNDLYQFHQTMDLKAVTSPHIRSLREFLYGDFRTWLSDVTGIELNSTVDMGSSQYGYTDVLLCHDDELEGRRVAYILYLTPPWYEKDGGMLDLFDVDHKGQPGEVVKSLQPKWNTFAFFEVSPVSFHQVQEVLAKKKVRLSINGWFHGPNIERPPKHVEPPRPLISPVDFDEDELYAWINPSYLDVETQKNIRKKFQNDSEIELESFLCEEKYKELSKAMQSKVLEWRNTRPANKQSYKILNQEKLPDIIKACSNFLKSEALFLILSQLTGLKLHHLAPPDSDPDSGDEEEENKNSSPGMTLDIRQWGHGCYTLLRDSDQGDKSSALDANLFVNVADGWTLDHGGFTSYIAKDEDEELLTVVPRSNCLALVYRDAETLKFTKYVNARVKDLGMQKSVFYDFCCTYKE